MNNPNQASNTNATAESGNTPSSSPPYHRSSSAPRISASTRVSKHLTAATRITASAYPVATQVRPSSRFSSPSGTPSPSSSRPWTPEVGVFRLSFDSDHSSSRSGNNNHITSRSPSYHVASNSSSDLSSSGSSRGIPMRRGTQYLHPPPTRGMPRQRIVGGFDWVTPPEQTSSLPDAIHHQRAMRTAPQQYQSGLTQQMQGHGRGREDPNAQDRERGRGGSNPSQGDSSMGPGSPYQRRF